jgi:hypothetical protein
MKKLMALAAAAAVAFGALGHGSATAAAFDIPLYSYTYYSDATHTAVVGWAWGVCYYDYAGTGPLQGQASAYEVIEQVGVCRRGMAIYW